MAVFDPNVPQAFQLLSNSQNDLLSNMMALDTSFGIDHYKFSDATANNGFHNTVTTPLVTPNPGPTFNPPATAAGIPKFYAMQDSANLGVIQYSRGPNNAVPTPVTSIQSPAAAQSINALATIPIFDFSGLARAMCHFQIMDTATLGTGQSAAICDIYYTGGSPGTFALTTYLTGLTTRYQFLIAGNVFTVKNNSGTALTNIYWSLQFLRTT